MPYAGLFFWPESAVWGYMAAVALMHATFGFISARLGGGVAVWPVLPAMYATFLFVLWRSAIITLRQGGVCWRDTFYSLDELRRNELR
jgi:hypothetical protein